MKTINPQASPAAVSASSQLLERSNERYAGWITLAFLLLVSAVLVRANAQTAVSTITSVQQSVAASRSYNAPGASHSNLTGNNYTYTFGTATQAANHQRRVTDITVNGEVLQYANMANSFVRMRRVNNAQVTGNRCLLWVEQKAGAAGSEVAVVPSYNDNMESVFDNNFLNQGTDNLFANQGDGNGNNNNIERLDVIFPGGIIPATLTGAGFSFFERGNDNQHDPFAVAAITAVDANGNPTAYGQVVRVATSHWGNIPASSVPYYIIRRDPATETNLRVSTSGTQNIGAVFVNFSDLGVAAGQKVFGYSIFAHDLPVSATPANLVDVTNETFFPRNTSSATQQGGIDLIALTGLFANQQAVILPPSANNITVPTMRNTAGITPIAPLEAQAASGTIASYTIATLPQVWQGVLYLCAGTCTPVTQGQVLTPAEIAQLSFQPANTFSGNVVFTYFATDTYNQVSNTATYTIPVIPPSSGPLPVRLAYFGGSINNRVVQLNWQTESEINSSYFELQRSLNGNSFSPVATFTAVGGSDRMAQYAHRDDLFSLMTQQVFYRLKMVDRDGSFKYSAVVNFRIQETKTKAPLSAWPVPFAQQVSLAFEAAAAGNATVLVTGVQGNVVLRQAVTVQKGNNTLALNNLQQLPRGTYVIRVMAQQQTETIVVQKQ